MRSVFDVVLYEPEIPPNTGNIIRLCANAGAALHLIEPLGFVLDDRRLRRAGLDYHEFAAVRAHPSLAAYLQGRSGGRLLACTTRGTANYAEFRFAPGDALLFGPESRGLPGVVLDTIPAAQRLCIPMRPGNRSLNLSNAVAVVLFEAWRQAGFGGAGACG
ncbi:putative rRNA methylase SpoU family [Thioflavicoccus mobilis 8321]|uniref:tRNA (cytidine(34)-2'-O)-methyltransferase n=1 Tax=Thioflavicoccus mobilis 8321 TaxID=765912 RepID=L0H271_9GAMM|nr:tRNA (cytidine(34)-2'-O)-methyltransferase [Thioflavicoccus mobilis]AGA92331.1 putative rRNA methylase SpoU family [Thioflavicoccus mobilis 8321]